MYYKNDFVKLEQPTFLQIAATGPQNQPPDLLKEKKLNGIWHRWFQLKVRLGLGYKLSPFVQASGACTKLWRLLFLV